MDKDTSVIGFHKPTESYGFLSNWYMSDFECNGVTFTSMEQYMMYNKAIVFGDEAIAKKILSTTDVSTIKQYGRQIKGYNDTIWNGLRQLIVYEGCKQKFRQNDKLTRKLIETEYHILAECAVQDRIWGIGLSMNDPRRFNIEEWRGKNLLGFTLMQVREIL